MPMINIRPEGDGLMPCHRVALGHRWRRVRRRSCLRSRRRARQRARERPDLIFAPTAWAMSFVRGRYAEARNRWRICLRRVHGKCCATAGVIPVDHRDSRVRSYRSGAGGTTEGVVFRRLGRRAPTPITGRDWPSSERKRGGFGAPERECRWETSSKAFPQCSGHSIA